MSNYPDRRSRLLGSLEEEGFVAHNLENSDRASIRYLTGFTGEGALVVAAEETVLLTDSRYTEQAKRETEGVRIEETRNWLAKGLAEALDSLGLRRVAFASNRVSHRWVEMIRDASGAELVSRVDPVALLRREKDRSEIEHLKTAAKIADEALTRLVDEIRVGMTEAEIALRLEWLIRENPQTEHVAFEPNVSTGSNTALNHYNPFHRPAPLRPGDLLLLDFGACVHGYRSDITRTFSVGTPSDEARSIYELVLRANRAGIEAAKAGETGVAVDAVARKLISANGHESHFGHGLGHGIGLEIHECPRLSPQSEDSLEVGMAATIEPGVYIPDLGGVRIEDDVIIHDGSCEVITAFPKDRLIEVG